MVESIELSIEETNKLRAQLGLPLIPTGKETFENSDEPQEFSGARSSRSNNLHSELGKFNERNLGNTLPDGKIEKFERNSSFGKHQSVRKVVFNYDDVDTESWLDSVGKERTSSLENSKIKQSIDESSESEESKTTIKHSAKSLGQLADGETFTLADGGVLDDSGDELVNDKLEKEAKLSRDLKERQKEDYVKFGKPRLAGENGDDDDDSDESKLSPIVLEGGVISLAQSHTDVIEETQKTANSGTIASIDSLFDDVEPPKQHVTMKKLKAKKSKGGSSRKRQREFTQVEESVPMFTATLEEDDDLEDDLEIVLNRARLNRTKARKKLTAEELALELQSHERADFAAEIDSDFVYNDTKDFLDTIGTIDTISAIQTNSSNPNKISGNESSATNIDTNQNSEEPTVSVQSTEAVGVSVDGIEETIEPSVKKDPGSLDLNSVSATLKYLRANSNISSGEKWRKTKADRERQRVAELAKIQINVEERLVRDQMASDPVFLKMTPEEQDKVIDRRLNDILIEKGIVAETRKVGRYAKYSGPADSLKDYNPNVNVEYKDSQGNQLDSKQAWKELSHRYHGSGPKHKKERVVRKSTEERLIH